VHVKGLVILTDSMAISILVEGFTKLGYLRMLPTLIYTHFLMLGGGHMAVISEG